MVKINGVNATNNFELKKQNSAKPTIKEILDRMENNYQNIYSVDTQNFSNKENTKNKFDELHKADTSNTGTSSNANILSSLTNMLGENKNINLPKENLGNDNLLLSILPMLLSKNKNASTLKTSENILFKQILKNSNNPRLMQIAELLPKIISKKNIEAETTEEVDNTPTIESYTKTVDFQD